MFNKKSALLLSLLCAMSFVGCGNKSVHSAANVSNAQNVSIESLRAYVPATAVAVAEIKGIPAPIVSVLNELFLERLYNISEYYNIDRLIEDVSDNVYREEVEDAIELMSVLTDPEDEEELAKIKLSLPMYKAKAEAYDRFLETCWSAPSEDALRSLLKEIDCNDSKNETDCSCVFYKATFEERDDKEEHRNLYVEMLRYELRSYDEVSVMMTAGSLNNYLKQTGFLPLEQTNAVMYLEDGRFVTHIQIANEALVDQWAKRQDIIEREERDGWYKYFDETYKYYPELKPSEIDGLGMRVDEGMLTLAFVSSIDNLKGALQKPNQAFDGSKVFDDQANANLWMNYSATYRSLMRFSHFFSKSTWKDEVCAQEVESIFAGANSLIASIKTPEKDAFSLSIKTPIESQELASFISSLVVPHDIYYIGNEAFAGAVGIDLKAVSNQMMSTASKEYHCSPLQDAAQGVVLLIYSSFLSPEVMAILSSKVIEGSQNESADLSLHIIGDTNAWLTGMFDMSDPLPKEGVQAPLDSDGDGAVYYKGQDLFITTDDTKDLSQLKPVRQSSSFFEGILNERILSDIYNGIFSKMTIDVFYKNDSIFVDITTNVNHKNSKNVELSRDN